MFATRVSRSLSMAVKRRNFSAISDKRKKFYDNNTAVGAENPTYLKEPQDKAMTGLAFAGLTVGCCCILNGLYSMANGVNKVPIHVK